MTLETVPLTDLAPHPLNSNVMPPAMLDKLTEHLRRNDRYPPLIVRANPDRSQGHAEAPRYQLLDGHHRAHALRAAGRDTARVLIWDVNDQEATLLLATLNRLQGEDDPRKRSALLLELSQHLSVRELAERLPEDGDKVRQMLKLAQAPPPAPAPPRETEATPVPVHVFLLPAEKRRLTALLNQLDEAQDRALMKLVELGESQLATTPRENQAE